MLDTDVFVIGGGPAGLAAAIAARRKGLRVMVADGVRPPIDKACGEGLMPDALAAAARLGITLPAEQAFALRGLRFTGCGHSMTADFPNGRGLGVRRTVLHQALVRQAEALGVRFHWGVPITGIGAGTVYLNGSMIRARWIVGADGACSRVRAWAGLDAAVRDERRYGFRRHYSLAPWSSYVEVHWAEGCQVYLTPVAAGEVCVVLISRDSHLRVEAALTRFPELQARLRGAGPAGGERGAITSSRRLRAVQDGQVALIGDASGSVDAITGEGLCLIFRQALALGESLEREDLRLYQAAHTRIARRPLFMAGLLLLMDRWSWVQRRALTALARDPGRFGKLVAMHVGGLRPAGFAAAGLSLGARMLAG